MAELLTGLAAGILASILFDLDIFEIGILLVLVCFWRVFARAPIFESIERTWSRFARRRGRVILLAFLAPIALRLCFLPWMPMPQPWIPDEFSHRLIADTLVHGRLANPTHPLWEHFESIHVFFRPTYASAYFPGLGVVLALGQLLGTPWIGVLLASGAMCAALAWMLYLFVPARWALLGSVIAVARWGAMSYWINSYWGGEVTALGGALVLGAWAWSRRGGGWRAGWILGAGLALIMSSRPLEGAVFAMPLAIALFSNSRGWRTLAAAAVLVVATLVGLGVYNKAVTGDALRIPYKVNQAEYGWPLTMPWEKQAQIVYRNSETRLYYEWERCVQQQKSWPVEAAKLSLLHLSPLWRFYFGPALTLSLFFLGGIVRNRRLRVPLISLAASCVLGFVIVAYPHYLAASTGCFLLLIVEGFRRARATLKGVAWSRIAIAACLAMLPIRALVSPEVGPWSKAEYMSFSANGSVKGEERYRIIKQLREMSGRHVVLVQYQRDQYHPGGWVYNGADIDGQQVVWAHDLGATRNQEVLSYYRDRHAWLLRVDESPPRLVPYEPALARDDPPAPAGAQVCPATP